MSDINAGDVNPALINDLVSKINSGMSADELKRLRSDITRGVADQFENDAAGIREKYESAKASPMDTVSDLVDGASSLTGAGLAQSLAEGAGDKGRWNVSENRANARNAFEDHHAVARLILGDNSLSRGIARITGGLEDAFSREGTTLAEVKQRDELSAARARANYLERIAHTKINALLQHGMQNSYNEKRNVEASNLRNKVKSDASTRAKLERVGLLKPGQMIDQKIQTAIDGYSKRGYHKAYGPL